MIKTMIVRDQLAEAAKAVADVATKDTLSPFSRIRLDVAGPAVSLTASDGSVQVEWRIEGDTEGSGTVTLPGRLFRGFCGVMPCTEAILVETKGAKLHLTAGQMRFSMATWDAADFPQMARPKDDAAEAEVDAEILKELLRKTSFAACQDGTRAVLCGVNFKITDGKLEMTATDGRRLAHAEYEVQGAKAGNWNFTLTNKTVGLLRALLAKESEYVRVIADRETVVFEGDAWHLTTRVIDAVYPNWSAVVPKTLEHHATLSRAELVVALTRASLSSDDTKAVEVATKGGFLTIEAKGEFSTSKETLTLKQLDGEMKKHFDWRLLKEALEAVDDDEVTISWNDEDSRAVVVKCTSPWLAVVMPLCLK